MAGPDRYATVIVARGDAEVARWPLIGNGRPDLRIVDELARMQLDARRVGWSIRLCDVSTALAALLDLLGLDVLGVEVGGQSERGEETGVEEVVLPDDPVPRDLDDL
jgi:hypothetical protein